MCVQKIMNVLKITPTEKIGTCMKGILQVHLVFHSLYFNFIWILVEISLSNYELTFNKIKPKALTLRLL